MSQVHLGRLLLRWCGHCDLPVLETQRCSICGGETHRVEITPPGDIRPAFPKDIELIRTVIDDQFGQGAGRTAVPEGRIVLLNKVPAMDRMDEVILGGEVIGSLRFDLDRGWTFLSRMPSARCLQDVITKGHIVVDDGAVDPILKSSNLLVPGVISFAPGISKGDEVSCSTVR